MYNLDFDTMKQVMQEHRKTGNLSSDISTGIAGIQGPCRIEIALEAGFVVSCLIIGRDGRRLPVKEPAKQLARLGRLKWTFTPQSESMTRSISSAKLAAVVAFPRRIVSLDAWQMQSWSRLHRMVFALADGTKSAEKIAGMLSATPDMVEKVLRDLQSIGAVSGGSPQNGRGYQNGMS